MVDGDDHRAVSGLWAMVKMRRNGNGVPWAVGGYASRRAARLGGGRVGNVGEQVHEGTGAVAGVPQVLLRVPGGAGGGHEGSSSSAVLQAKGRPSLHSRPHLS